MRVDEAVELSDTTDAARDRGVLLLLLVLGESVLFPGGEGERCRLPCARGGLVGERPALFAARCMTSVGEGTRLKVLDDDDDATVALRAGVR